MPFLVYPKILVVTQTYYKTPVFIGILKFIIFYLCNLNIRIIFIMYLNDPNL